MVNLATKFEKMIQETNRESCMSNMLEFLDASSAVLKQLNLARRLLEQIEDRHFIMQDFEIIKSRKSSKWFVVHPVHKHDGEFDHPLDAAIWITEAKAMTAAVDAARSASAEPGPVHVAELEEPPAGTPPLAFRGTPLITNPTLGGPPEADTRVYLYGEKP